MKPNKQDCLSVDQLLEQLFALRSKLPEGQLTNVISINMPLGGRNLLALETLDEHEAYNEGWSDYKLCVENPEIENEDN